MKKLLLGFALALAGCGGQAKVVGSQQQAREPSFSCPLPPPNINPGLDPDVVPTLSSASPASIAMGGPDFTLTANGGGFTTESVLRWNGDDRTTQFVSGGQLRASILAGDIATPGLAQLTVFNPGPDGGESNVLNFPVFIRQTCNDLIYDPFSGLIFASVPSIVGGNAIVSIDPYTGEVSNSVFVGSEPGKLAVSDDGQSLFVALNGAAAVRQVDIPSMTAGLQFPLGSDPFFGPMYVEDMQVLPGYPDSIAVSRKYQGFSPRHAGVAVYDSGVRRPTQTPGHTGSNVIQFSASADTLYGYNNETTEFGFRRMRVDDSGVTILDSTGNLISGFGVDIRFDSGDWQIYSTTGRVIDPVERILVGTFPGIGFGSLVKPDAATGRAFFLTGDDPTRTLRVFDPNTFTPLGDAQIPGVSGGVSSLIQWGDNGLAFRTGSNQVFVIPSPIPAAGTRVR